MNAKEGAHDKDAYPVGLNERVPQLRIIPRSPLLISNTENFKFDIEYEFNEDEDFYLAIALHDIKRGGIPYDSGGKTFKMEKGRHIASF